MIPAVTASSSATSFDYKWIAAGESGQMFTSTSTTASTWTSVTSSFGTTNINGIASNRTNLWVAVGDSGKLATSSNGEVWTQQTSSFGTTSIQAVAHANGYWVAVGASGKLATSTDGITWTQQTSNSTTTLYGISYGFGYWVAGGGYSVLGTARQTISTGSNPTTGWTLRTTTLTDACYHTSCFNFVTLFHQGHDTGTTGALQTSPTGVTWTARASTTSILAGYATSAEANATVAVLVGGDSTGPIQSSTNGTTWTARTAAYSYLTPTGRCVAVDGSNLIASVVYDAFGGKNVYVQTTSDGITWTARGLVGFSTNSTANCLAHSAGPISHR